jgi:hypothetical protein
MFQTWGSVLHNITDYLSAARLTAYSASEFYSLLLFPHGVFMSHYSVALLTARHTIYEFCSEQRERIKKERTVM